MNYLEKYTKTDRLILISLLGALFITYPNIVCLPWDIKFYNEKYHTSYIFYFILRYLYFTALIWIIAAYNLKKNRTSSFSKRLLYTSIITSIAYAIYISLTFITDYKADWLGSILPFQFFVVCILSAFTGHILVLTNEKQKKELEIEQLKTENLQSRYDALTNQINPHFFFNSLNGLTSLIRKKNEVNALEYVNKLSDVFRYILQSDKKGLITLWEELEFVKSFSYLMEVRFANKLVFNTYVPEDERDLKLPVLSLLPLIENVAVHNTIDSEHIMIVDICLNSKLELSVSNPIFPKLSVPDTNGTGLVNLEHRFQLLMNQQIVIENNGKQFTVYLPLKKDKDEIINS